MATIRIPESAESLLPFCRTSGTNGPHLWETYADMITFLAAYAYGHEEIPPPKPALLKGANPIDLGVFRTRGLYPILLTMVIAVRRDWLVTKQPDEICECVECFAAAGAKLLSPSFVTAGSLSEILLAEFRPESSRPQRVSI